MGNSTMAPVSRTVDVNANQRVAFDTFTTGINRWWPLKDYSVGAEKAASVVMECVEGGSLYEVWDDGSRCEWGKVLVFEPNDRLVLSWYPGREEDKPTEVEVNFIPDGDITRVELEHRGWEILGVQAGAERAGYEGGWKSVLEGYEAAFGS